MATLQDSLANPAVLVAGTNVTLDQPAPGDPVTISAPSIGGGGATPAAHVIKTAGNYTINNTAWTNLDTSLDLTLPAADGDTIEVSLAAYVVPNSSAQYASLDVVTVVAGSVTKCASSGTATPAQNGCTAWMISGTRGDGPVAGPVMMTLAAGDVTGGNVTVRIRFKTANAVNHTIQAVPGNPLHFSVKNLGQ